jgi:hypothetical protein
MHAATEEMLEAVFSMGLSLERGEEAMKREPVPGGITRLPCS